MAYKVGTGDIIGYSHDRRDETATPLVGAHRCPKGNPLLVKPQLGSVKSTAYDLPENFQFTYGMAQERDGLTAGTVISNWAQHAGTKNKLPARDFTALNKAAIIEGNLNASAIRQYTKTHDIRVQLGGEQKQAPLPIDEDTTFGKGVRPGTPFNDLLSHAHRYDWVMGGPLAENVNEERKPQKPQPTKASQAHAAGAEARATLGKTAQLGFSQPQSVEGMWKMKKFSNVSSKVGKQGHGV